MYAFCGMKKLEVIMNTNLRFAREHWTENNLEKIEHEMRTARSVK